MPRPKEVDPLCDIIGDMLSLQTLDLERNGNSKRLLTFPQIWVESVCEDSSDDDEASQYHRHRVTQDTRIDARLMSFSSTDVSFESSSLSPSSTRQNSLQAISRESSVERSEESTTTTAKATTATTLITSTKLETLTAEEDEEEQCDAYGDDHDARSDAIRQWLEKILAGGFDAGLLRNVADKATHLVEDELSDEDDDTWWDKTVVRVFDPYVEISVDEIVEVEGRTNAKGGPVGVCTVRLQNGDNLFGTFRNGLRQGRGALDGTNVLQHGLVLIRGFYKDGILTGEGRAILSPGAWLNTSRITLEGIFSNGYLEGPVRGIDEKGNVSFIGSFVEGVASGPCWLAREGQGWLHGVVNEFGHFDGDNIMFVYPDLSTCLVGKFNNERLVSTKASKIINATINENGVMVLTAAKPDPGSPELGYCPSNRERIPCDWNLLEPYEETTVFCRPSLVDGAGDGLFAARDLPAQRIVSYYNGLHINAGEPYNTSSFSYQIYVDWNNTDNSPFVDIPNECTDITTYQASLGHKANHSFLPNCQFIAVDHPRFGRIPALKTIKPIKKGEELFSHYKYDTALAPSWYQEAWNRLHDPEALEENIHDLPINIATRDAEDALKYGQLNSENIEGDKK